MKRSRFITDIAEVSKGTSLLDVGTGEGVYISKMSAKGAYCVGIDIDGSHLRKAMKDNGESSFAKMSADSLAFMDHSFDVVIMVEVLEHLPDVRRSISEVRRVLKPGGQFIVTAPNKLCPFETHGIRIGNKGYSSRGIGFPIVPYFPERLRSKCTFARVFTPRALRSALDGFTIERISFLAPGMDQARLSSRTTGIFDALVGFGERLERSAVFSLLMPTIMISAKKSQLNGSEAARDPSRPG